MPPSARVLVVDDDPAVATMLARALGRHGFEVETARGAEDAIRRAGEARYDAALVDLVMPGRSGTELAAALREKIPGLPIALLTGYARSPLIAAAERSGFAVFAKPVVIDEVVGFLKAELPRRALAGTERPPRVERSSEN